MTEEQVNQLKPGDKIVLLRKTHQTDEGECNIAEVLDPPLYITLDANLDSVTLVRYYMLLHKVNNVGVTGCVLPEDCELAPQASKKCTCDFYKTILTVGCKCGGF